MLAPMSQQTSSGVGSEDLQVSIDDGICTVTLSRPAKKNAFTNAMYAGLADALESLEGHACRCLLLQADGDTFSAGNDLNDFLSLERFDTSTPVVRVLKLLAALDIPLVAAVDGPAVGIGTTLLLHCDLVFATPEARFAVPFVPLGLVPEAGSSRLLPELVGYRRAMAMFLLGEVLDAEGALAAGLVSHLSPRDRLASDALAAAQRIASLPEAAVRATRHLCRQEPASISDTIDREITRFAEQLQSQEARDAIQAVLSARSSKRP